MCTGIVNIDKQVYIVVNKGSLFRLVLFEVLQLLSEDDVSGTLSKFL